MSDSVKIDTLADLKMITRRGFVQAAVAVSSIGVDTSFRMDPIKSEYTIIDAHAHLGDFRTYAPNLFATPEDLVAECQERGISKMIPSHDSAIEQDPEPGNDEVIRAASQFADHLIPAVSFPSPFHSRALQLLESYARRGVRILGEIKFEKLNVPAAIAMLSKAAELGMIILAHADTNDAVQAARAVPEAQIIVAHLGTGVSTSPYAWRESIDVARKQRNIYFETCTSVVERGMIEEFVNFLGAERVIFGTDFPLLDVRVMIAKILDADISDSDRRLIFGGNVQRLLRQDN